MIYTYGPEGFPYDYFGAQVYTKKATWTLTHDPRTLMVMAVCTVLEMLLPCQSKHTSKAVAAVNRQRFGRRHQELAFMIRVQGLGFRVHGVGFQGVMSSN